MKTEQEIQRELNQLLTKGFAIIENYLSAELSLNSYMGKSVSNSNVYKGRCISSLLSTYFKNLAKKLTNQSTTAGRACFDGEELESICIGHIKINTHDSEYEKQHTVEGLLNDCKIVELVSFIERKGSSLVDEGLRLAANNIISGLELSDRRKITGKEISRTARHFHLFSHLCYYNTHSATEKFRNLSNDLKVMCDYTGIDDCAQNFYVLSNDLFYLPYGGRIQSNTKYQEDRGLLTVYKSHIKLTLSHEDFEALLTFVMTHKSDDVELDKSLVELGMAA